MKCVVHNENTKVQVATQCARHRLNSQNNNNNNTIQQDWKTGIKLFDSSQKNNHKQTLLFTTDYCVKRRIIFGAKQRVQQTFFAIINVLFAQYNSNVHCIGYCMST